MKIKNELKNENGFLCFLSPSSVLHPTCKSQHPLQVDHIWREEKVVVRAVDKLAHRFDSWRTWEQECCIVPRV